MLVLHKTECIKMKVKNMSFQHIYMKYFNLNIRRWGNSMSSKLAANIYIMGVKCTKLLSLVSISVTRKI